MLKLWREKAKGGVLAVRTYDHSHKSAESVEMNHHRLLKQGGNQTASWKRRGGVWGNHYVTSCSVRIKGRGLHALTEWRKRSFFSKTAKKGKDRSGGGLTRDKNHRGYINPFVAGRRGRIVMKDKKKVQGPSLQTPTNCDTYALGKEKGRNPCCLRHDKEGERGKAFPGKLRGGKGISGLGGPVKKGEEGGLEEEKLDETLHRGSALALLV